MLRIMNMSSFINEKKLVLKQATLFFEIDFC